MATFCDKSIQRMNSSHMWKQGQHSQADQIKEDSARSTIFQKVTESQIQRIKSANHQAYNKSSIDGLPSRPKF